MCLISGQHIQEVGISLNPEAAIAKSIFDLPAEALPYTLHKEKR